MALAETIYKPRIKGLAIGEITAAGSFLMATVGVGWLMINEHQVREEANIIFPPIANEEEISRAKVTTSLFEGQMWDLIDLGETTIRVPSSISEARNLVKMANTRNVEYQEYFNNRSRQHLWDLTPVPENISYGMLITGLAGFFLSAPILPRRWRRYH